MLCLTAKEGEYLMIGDDIKLVFLYKKASDAFLIGISAPKSVAIRRDKVFEKELTEHANNTERTPEEMLRAAQLLQKTREETARLDTYRMTEKCRRKAKWPKKETAASREPGKQDERTTVPPRQNDN